MIAIYYFDSDEAILNIIKIIGFQLAAVGLLPIRIQYPQRCTSYFLSQVNNNPYTHFPVYAFISYPLGFTRSAKYLTFKMKHLKFRLLFF